MILSEFCQLTERPHFSLDARIRIVRRMLNNQILNLPRNVRNNRDNRRRARDEIIALACVLDDYEKQSAIFWEKVLPDDLID